MGRRPARLRGAGPLFAAAAPCPAPGPASHSKTCLLSRPPCQSPKVGLGLCFPYLLCFFFLLIYNKPFLMEPEPLNNGSCNTVVPQKKKKMLIEFSYDPAIPPLGLHIMDIDSKNPARHPHPTPTAAPSPPPEGGGRPVPIDGGREDQTWSVLTRNAVQPQTGSTSRRLLQQG